MQVQIHVVRDHKVHEAVVIVISKSCAHGPATVGNSCFLCYIGERAVAIVAVQNVAAVARKINVRPAIVVVVRYGAAHCITRSAYAGFIRHVGKRTVVIVVIQCPTRLLSLQGLVHGRGIREVNVQPPVPVVIQQKDSATHGFDDVLRHGRRIMRKVDARLFCDVFQLRYRPVLAFRVLRTGRRRHTGGHALPQRTRGHRQCSENEQTPKP